jgi:DNA-binding XRE family transcriptional regulator
MRIKLIEARKKFGLTQEALARLLGITKQSMSKLENEITDGSVKIWHKLEKILNVPQSILQESDNYASNLLVPPVLSEDEIIKKGLKLAIERFEAQEKK